MKLSSLILLMGVAAFASAALARAPLADSPAAAAHAFDGAIDPDYDNSLFLQSVFHMNCIVDAELADLENPTVTDLIKLFEFDKYEDSNDNIENPQFAKLIHEKMAADKGEVTNCDKFVKDICAKLLDRGLRNEFVTLCIKQLE